MSEPTDGLSLEVAAQQIQSARADTELFVQMLARNLGESLGGQVELRKKGLIKRTVHGITVHAADAQLALDVDPHGHVHCFRRPVVHGIALEGDAMGLSEWLSALLDATKTDAATRNAVNSALQSSLL